MKECEEIAQIFSAYEININKVEAEYVPYKLRASQGATHLGSMATFDS